MIGVILAAGKGTRMHLKEKGRSKCMLPVEGEPLLIRKIRQIADSGCVRKLILVVREEDKEIRETIGSFWNNVPVTYVIQDKKRPGLVNALYSVPEYESWRDETVLVNLGDEYYGSLDYHNLAESHMQEGADLTAVLVPTLDESKICNNYTAELEIGGRIRGAKEKPDCPFNQYIGCGTLVIRGKILVDFAQRMKAVRPFAEFDGLELTDWINVAVREERICRAYLYEGLYCNLNTDEDYRYLSALAGERGIREFIYGDFLYLSVSEDYAGNLGTVRNQLLEVMAEYELPRRIWFVRDGKLPDLRFRRCESDCEYTEAGNWLEQALCQVWKDLLQVSQVGIYDNFFHLGGNYTMAKRLVSQIRSRLRIRVPVSRILIAEPTVHQIACNIKKYLEGSENENFAGTEFRVSLL